MSEREWYLLDGPMRFEELRAIGDGDQVEQTRLATERCIADISKTVDAWLGDQPGYDAVHKDKDGNECKGLLVELLDDPHVPGIRFVRAARRVARTASSGRGPLEVTDV